MDASARVEVEHLAALWVKTPPVMVYEDPTHARAEHVIHEVSHAALLGVSLGKWTPAWGPRLSRRVSNACTALFPAVGVLGQEVHELRAVALEEVLTQALGITPLLPVPVEKILREAVGETAHTDLWPKVRLTARLEFNRGFVDGAIWELKRLVSECRAHPSGAL